MFRVNIDKKLHKAAERGDARAVRRLLASGADVAYRNREGATALHLACIGGRAPVVNALLEAGADPNA